MDSSGSPCESSGRRAVHDNVWNVLDVLEGSPAKSAGLVPFGDWLVGSSGGPLCAESDIYGSATLNISSFLEDPGADCFVLDESTIDPETRLFDALATFESCEVTAGIVGTPFCEAVLYSN
ncbi:hypothetical protein AURDEDRAFT_165947 [Auricularia subglabra TFB-10046 SS5]|nr:hypothetical protein AURDEDRAFT_165947 [Auricularia subglabra TFB-10046 SS5]